MQNAQKAAYAKKKIRDVGGYSIPFSSPTFNEFVVRGPGPAAQVLEMLRTQDGIIGGLALSKYYSGHENDFLVCTTETNTREQIDAVAAALA